MQEREIAAKGMVKLMLFVARAHGLFTCPTVWSLVYLNVVKEQRH